MNRTARTPPTRARWSKSASRASKLDPAAWNLFHRHSFNRKAPANWLHVLTRWQGWSTYEKGNHFWTECGTSFCCSSHNDQSGTVTSGDFPSSQKVFTTPHTPSHRRWFSLSSLLFSMHRCNNAASNTMAHQRDEVRRKLLKSLLLPPIVPPGDRTLITKWKIFQPSPSVCQFGCQTDCSGPGGYWKSHMQVR